MIASGYSVPVTFAGGSGASIGDSNALWLVADVLFLPQTRRRVRARHLHRAYCTPTRRCGPSS